MFYVKKNEIVTSDDNRLSLNQMILHMRIKNVGSMGRITFLSIYVDAATSAIRSVPTNSHY